MASVDPRYLPKNVGGATKEYGGRGNVPVAPTIAGGYGSPVNPNQLSVNRTDPRGNVPVAPTIAGSKGKGGGGNVNTQPSQPFGSFKAKSGTVASAPPSSTAATSKPATQQGGAFDFRKIMEAFYNYKPKEDGDATDMQKQAYQGNMVQSILDSQLAQQLGQYNAGLAQDNMTHQADLEQRNQSALMGEEFNYGMAGMDAQFKYGEQGSQNQHERDIGMLSATGEEQRLNLSAQGDQDRLGQIVSGEQARLTNDLNNKSAEAIAGGRYSADTTIASTQADASKYGSKEAADASKYGSQASKDASIYGSTAQKDSSFRSSQASENVAGTQAGADMYGADQARRGAENVATTQKEASDYGADKSLEGSKYSTDGTIRNTRATGDETRKTMGTEQQLKAKERASMHKYARGTARAM